MKKPLILYHANCPDGFSAAWAAWKKFGKRAEYYPVSPNELPPILPKKREVYLLDHCYITPSLLKLRMANERVTVVDHHTTNASHIRHATEHVFDVKHSGAFLAWHYFHPKKKVPALIAYIEDGDLWRFKLQKAKMLLAYVYARPFAFKEYDMLARGMESARERKRFIELGKALEEYNQILVMEAVARAELVQFGKYKALAVNSSSKRFHSEIGQALREKRPPLGIVWRVERGMLYVSLRTNEGADAGKLAAQFPGGGGHPRAAGFTIPFKNVFPWKVLESR
ncbi:MAG: DHHA1 domain-containing protein [Candidatus Brennerbacteria bacterium]